MTARAIDALRLLPAEQAIDVRVLVGAANRALDAIEAAAVRSDVAVTLERSVKDVPGRMAWADLALVSGGSTVWELAAMGCPALVVETAPSEPILTGGLRRLGLFDVLGPAEDASPELLASRVAKRLADVEWRREMADRGPRHVDGGGANRVVGALAALAAGA